MKKLVLVFVTVIMVMLSSCKKEEAPQPRSPQSQPSQNDDLSSEIVGCMDPTSLNYNPEATTSNGSCEYADEEVGEEIEDFYFEITHRDLKWKYTDKVVIIQRINNEVIQTIEITQDMIVYGTTSDRNIVIKFDEQYLSEDIMNNFRNTDYRNSNFEVIIITTEDNDDYHWTSSYMFFGERTPYPDVHREVMLVNTNPNTGRIEYKNNMNYVNDLSDF